MGTRGLNCAVSGNISEGGVQGTCTQRTLTTLHDGGHLKDTGQPSIGKCNFEECLLENTGSQDGVS